MVNSRVTRLYAKSKGKFLTGSIMLSQKGQYPTFVQFTGD
jgi:hypothetical protein